MSFQCYSISWRKASAVSWPVVFWRLYKLSFLRWQLNPNRVPPISCWLICFLTVCGHNISEISCRLSRKAASLYILGYSSRRDLMRPDSFIYILHYRQRNIVEWFIYYFVLDETPAGRSKDSLSMRVRLEFQYSGRFPVTVVKRNWVVGAPCRGDLWTGRQIRKKWESAQELLNLMLQWFWRVSCICCVSGSHSQFSQPFFCLCDVRGTRFRRRMRAHRCKSTVSVVPDSQIQGSEPIDLGLRAHSLRIRTYRFLCECQPHYTYSDHVWAFITCWTVKHLLNSAPEGHITNVSNPSDRQCQLRRPEIPIIFGHP